MGRKIGVYAGSFNPFHKGHYNVLLKAEKIFDVVIIAIGINPFKQDSTYAIPEIIKDRIIMPFDGLLTEFVKGIAEEEDSQVTVIRGIRGMADVEYEMNQYRYYQDFLPEISLVSIFCDKEYEHISSSAIRKLDDLGVEHKYDFR